MKLSMWAVSGVQRGCCNSLVTVRCTEVVCFTSVRLVTCLGRSFVGKPLSTASDLAIVAGSMTRQMALLTALLVFATGCEELSARRAVQRGNKLYEDKKFEKAIEEFKIAVKTRPKLMTAQLNLGLAYYKLFRVGDDSPENKQAANNATQHLEIYLASDPDNHAVEELLTHIWTNSGQHPKAIHYWKQQAQARPNDPKGLRNVARLYLQDGKWRESIQWLKKQLAVEKKQKDKIEAYKEIADIVFAEVANLAKYVGSERIEVADIAIAALQAGLALDPDELTLHQYLGSFFHFRAMAHGATWARMVDEASGRQHGLRASEIIAAQRKQFTKSAPNPKKSITSTKPGGS